MNAPSDLGNGEKRGISSNSGEMAELIRSFDWSQTPIGSRERWPVSLKTVVNTLLASQFPTALLWGPELLLIYNDAYRKICADKHPSALGRSTREIWSEVWHINEPIFAAVMERGETLYFEDKLFPINRRGFNEDAYFTLCYSPVWIEDGSIGGTLVVLQETTERKQSGVTLQQSEERLALAASGGRIGMFEWDIATGKTRWTAQHARLLGFKTTTTTTTTTTLSQEYSYHDWAQRVHPDDLSRVEAELRRCLAEHVPYEAEYRVVWPDKSVHWLVGRGVGVYDAQGNPMRMLGIVMDITERKDAEKRMAAQNQFLQDILEAITHPFYVINADDYTIALSNQATRAGKQNGNATCYALTHGRRTPCDSAQHACPLEIARKTRQPVRVEHVHLNAHGEQRIVEVHGYPIFNEQGHLKQLIEYALDITERKQAEKALRASENKYRDAIEKASDVILVADTQGNILLANHQASEALGYTQVELCRMNIADTYPVGEREVLAKRLVEMKTGKPLRYERPMLRKDGTIFPVDVTVGQLPDGSIQGIHRDITERKRAEHLLRATEEQLRDVIDSTPFPVALVDMNDDKIFMWSHSAKEIFGHIAPTAQEWYQIAYPDPEYRRDVGNRWKPLLEKARSSNQTINMGEYHVTCNNGSIRVCELYARFLPQHILVTFNDITERKLAEKALRALTVRLEHVREEDRTRIAREVHDVLGQLLAGLGMDVASIKKHTLNITDEKLRHRMTEKLDDIDQLSDMMIQTVHDISSELRPSVLDNLGLVSAIRFELDRFQKRSGIACKLASSTTSPSLNLIISTAIFRILQEILTNVARHAQAKQVKVSFAKNGGFVELMVSDDGRGITPRQLSDPKSLGLLGMKERAAQFGGTIKICGKRGKGTTVMIRMPIENQKRDVVH